MRRAEHGRSAGQRLVRHAHAVRGLEPALEEESGPGRERQVPLLDQAGRVGQVPFERQEDQEKEGERARSVPLLERRPDPCMVDPARGAVAGYAGRSVERAVHDEGAGNRRRGQILRGRSGDPAPKLPLSFSTPKFFYP